MVWEKYNGICKQFGMYYDNVYRSFIMSSSCDNFWYELDIVVEESHMVLFFMPYYEREYTKFLNKLGN